MTATQNLAAYRIPMLVSPDDHIVEPPNLWTDRLPSKFTELGPHTRRMKGTAEVAEGWIRFRPSDDGHPCDVWFIGDVMVDPTINFTISAGLGKDQINSNPMTYDEMRPSCYQSKARLQSMDEAGIWASLCFPNMFARFAGQRLSDIPDKELALLCIRAYNDFVADEWCARSGGRLLGMSVIPFWDAQLAADEIRRCAALGFKSVTFSEAPHMLGLPSIHSGYWDPFFAACAETDTIVSTHFGTGNPSALIARDAIGAIQMVTPALDLAHTMLNFIFSGVLSKFPTLKVILAESQVGWVPYLLHRADTVWEETDQFLGIDKTVMPEPPSFYFEQNIWVTFFKDSVGIDMLDQVGAHKVLYETDFPHQDSAWPTCRDTAQRLTSSLSTEDAVRLTAGNACQLFGIPDAPYALDAAPVGATAS